MDKPFRTIDEQIALLNSRGMATGESARTILMSEGYYSVVNGYKAPFIDAEASEACGDDRYIAGTTLEDLYSLFLFDRELREATFHRLLQVEALVRTVCVYTFCENHRGIQDYLDQSCFATESEYVAHGLKHYRNDLSGLQSIMLQKASKSSRDFIVHYRMTHNGVPLWVLAMDMTFGNIEHFFNLMKPEEQSTVCRRIVEAAGHAGGPRGFFNPKEARIGLDIIVKIRNMCAHDERLYCAKINKRIQADYMDFLVFLQRYLSKDDMLALINEVIGLVNRYSGMSGAVGHILAGLGFDKVIDTSRFAH